MTRMNNDASGKLSEKGVPKKQCPQLCGDTSQSPDGGSLD